MFVITVVLLMVVIVYLFVLSATRPQQRESEPLDEHKPKPHETPEQQV